MPLRLIHALGDLVGWLMYLYPTASKRTTIRNLQMCFPEKEESEIRQLAKESLQETAKAALELGRIWMTSVPEVLSLVVKTTNMDLVNAAVERGKGLIVVAPHLGNWEIYGLKITSVAPTTYLYKPPKLPVFDKAMTGFRSRGGAQIVPTNRQGVMQLVKALQRGEIIGILPDQEPDLNGGVFAPFFKIDALTMTLVSKLAARTGASVVCGFAKRLPKSAGYEVIFRSVDAEISSDDAVLAATALNNSVESCVREAISQYQWEYKRFKKRPPGDERRLYY